MDLTFDEAFREDDCLGDAIVCAAIVPAVAKAAPCHATVPAEPRKRLRSTTQVFAPGTLPGNPHEISADQHHTLTDKMRTVKQK